MMEDEGERECSVLKPGRSTDQPSRRDPEFSFCQEALAYEEGQDHGDQTSALDECGGQDHVRADIAQRFRLTCDGFHGFTANLTNAETDTNYCQSGSNCCVHNFKNDE